MLLSLWRPQRTLAAKQLLLPQQSRPQGRFLGLVGPLAAEWPELAATALQVEWSHCWLGEQAITRLEQWQDLLAAGKLPALNGAFALAWQRPDGSYLLARDALGERTLFYTLLQPTGHPAPSLLWASSLEQLLATGLVQRQLNPLALARYLSYAYVPGRETLLQGVFELPPASLLQWPAAGAQQLPEPLAYWQIPAYPDEEAEVDEQALRQQLRHELEQAVRRRLPAGELHASLSGGIDSSLVVALAGQLTGRQVHTYSISFGEQYKHELPYSQAVADHCRTRHRVLTFEPRVVLQHLDQAMAQLGNPIGDPLTAPNFLLFAQISQQMGADSQGVVFNGEGGDPNFGGPKNLAMLLACLYGDQCAPGMSLETLYLQSYRKCFVDLQQMLRPAVWAEIAGQLEPDLQPWFASDHWQGLINRLMAINVAFKGCHHILYKVNHLSYPFGVVPASPLFDRAVTEMAFAIPPWLKLKGSVEKYLLKEAVRDLLPGLVVDRPKSGMMVPVEGWFKPGGPLHRQARARIRELEKWQLFEPTYLKRLLTWQLGGYQPRHGAKLWILLALESWLQHYLPQR